MKFHRHGPGDGRSAGRARRSETAEARELAQAGGAAPAERAGGAAVDLRVLGCKVNFADAAALAARLPETGAGPMALVGTCCVTAEGEKQSRQEVRRAARRVGPGGTVFVSGCAVRRNPERFKGLADNVVLVLDDPMAAPAAGEPLPQLSHKGAAAAAVAGQPAGSAAHAAERTRFFLKIQDGCANRCVFCVIPLVRGRPRSVPLSRILSEARSALAAGYPELVVTGINAGQWRDGGRRLPQLLDELAGLDGLLRLRLSSVEIGHVSDDLIEVMARRPVIGRHLHLPLQSGDDLVLRDMGRRYTAAEFSGRVRAAREALPGLNLTTDAIVGFPTENDIAFNHTMWLVEELGFSKVHVFSYSLRPGTAAERLGDRVPAAVKKRRSRFLRFLSDRQQQAHWQRKLGEVSEILLESGRGGESRGGYSSDYTRFLVSGSHGGELARVLAESVTGEGIAGKVIDYD